MEPRPRLQIKLSAADKIIEFISLLLLLLLVAFTFYAYYNLPSTIPVHFNVSGKPDGFGSKSTLFLLAGISVIVYALLSVLNRFPHIFNYPVSITKLNAAKQYHNATQMIRVLKLSITVVFLITQLSIYMAVKGWATVLQPYLLPIILLVILVPIIFYVVKSFKK